MKRYILFIATFIFVFSLNFLSVFASSGGGGLHTMAGYSTWSKEDKMEYQNYVLRMWLPGGYEFETLADEILAREYPDYYTNGNASYKDFLIEHSTVDEDAETLTYDDDAMVFINALKADAEEKITYIDGYFYTSSEVLPDFYIKKSVYDHLVSLIAKNPNCAFILSEHPSNNGYARHGISAVVDPAYCVSSDITAERPVVQFYNSDWQMCDYYQFYYFTDDYTQTWDGVDYQFQAQHLYVRTKDKTDETLTLVPAYVEYYLPCDDIQDGIDKAVPVTYQGKCYMNRYYNHDSVNPDVSTPQTIFCDKSGSIPIFNSVSNMKLGTVNGVCGQFLPNYSTGTVTDNSVTQSEINDYSTTYNYYYGTSGDGGGGSGSGSDDGGGSSGNWLDSLLNGIGSLGNAIMSIISKIIEILGQAIELIVSTITDFTDLVTGGFTDFLTAVFPFLPEEFVKIIGLGLVLAVFGVIIRCFIG